MPDAAANNRNILIVDDDRFLLEMYGTKFKEQGFNIETAFSGPEALAKVEREGFKPQVCLIDIIMPEMDGFQLIGELKKRNICTDAVLVILSNLGQQEDINRGLQLGADGYIIKASATPTEVVNKVLDITKTKQKI